MKLIFANKLSNRKEFKNKNRSFILLIYIDNSGLFIKIILFLVIISLKVILILLFLFN